MGRHELVDEDIATILKVHAVGDDDGVEIEVAAADLSLNGDYKIYVSLSKSELDYLSYRSIVAPLEDKIQDLEHRLEFLEER